MAMSVNISEVRPRKHYFWIFGLSILILIGVILTKYDLTSDLKITSLNVDPLVRRNQRLASNGLPGKENESQKYNTKISREKLRVKTHSDGSISTTKITKEKIKIRRNVTMDGTKLSSALEMSNPKLNTSKSTRGKDLEEAHFIVYAKVHKAASSVIQNMLLRFALSRKLNVLLPVQGHLLSETSSRIDQREIFPLPKGERYNILCNHVIFNKKQAQRFFPESTKYIGIIRHPLRQLSSALYYYATRYKKSNYPLVYKRHPNNPVYGFLSRPQLYDLDHPKNSFVNNRMSIDLGFPVSYSFEHDKRNKWKITDFVKDLDKTFHLILVVELFDESLILLRRLLHWKTEDILYMKLNVRSEADKLKVKDTEKDLHKRWAPIDYAVYGFFREKLEKEITSQGEDFQRELANYKIIQKKAVQFCESGINVNISKLAVKSTKWSTGFAVTQKLCNFMTEGETSMVSKVKARQKKRLGSDWFR